MKKTGETIDRRRAYIKQRVNNRNSSIKNEVRHIARELFLSERTVYRDLHC